jgi:hypothetical protein
MWRDLVRAYALRAREFSDTVAKLGTYVDTGPEFTAQILEIEKRRAICQEAADQLDLYILKHGGKAKSA